MLGSVVLGVTDGLNIALIAIGLVLVFRGARFVNFAQAQLGVVPMLLLGKMVLEGNVNWWLAAVLMIFLGALLGSATEFLVIRRLAGRGPLTLLVATVGVAQLALGLSYFPWLGANESSLVLSGYPVPFSTTWTIAGETLYTNRIMTIFIVPLICLALFAFFKYAKAGKGIRAAASNPAAAKLAGLPGARLSLITWAIAGTLAALAAILSAPNQAVFDPSSLGPDLMLPALGAAAFGAFTSFQLTFVAAIALGVIEDVVTYATGNGTWGELALFVAVLVGLFMRARTIGLVGMGGGTGGDSFAAMSEKIHMPAALQGKWYIRHSRLILGVVAVAIAVLLPLVAFTSASQTFRLAEILVMILLVVSLTVMIGWGGQLSLGQYAFAGIGAFMSARFIGSNWPLPGSLLVTGLIGAAIAIVIGLPSLRYRGLSLAVTTLGFAVIVPEWLFEQSWFQPHGFSGSGLSISAPYFLGHKVWHLTSVRDTYFAILIVVALLILALAALHRSLAGKVFVAVRDNEDAASSIGISPVISKLALFAIVGFIGALAGGLDLLANSGLNTSRYIPDTSLLVLTIAVMGGLGSVAGGVVGTVMIFGVPLLLTNVFVSIFPGGDQLPLMLGGFGVIITLISTQHGIWGEMLRSWMRLVERLSGAADPEVAVEGGVSVDSATVAVNKLDAATLSGGATAVSKEAHAVAEGESSVFLNVSDIKVKFGPLVALSDVNVVVNAGEIVGLIGNNGAGKSTLINTIAGAVSPAEGTIELFGSDCTRLSVVGRARLGLGRTFQDAHLFPGLTALEIVSLAVSAREGRSSSVEAMLSAPWVRRHDAKLAREARDVLNTVGLLSYADTESAKLSTGLRRVLDLAIQLALRPRLILLDEPTAGLAQRESEAFVPLLRNVAGNIGASILIIEHDMPVILGVTDRIYCLELGRVIAEGTPEEIRKDSRVIESYLGSEHGTGAQRSNAVAVAATAMTSGALTAEPDGE